jgi:hypothetical protein
MTTAFDHFAFGASFFNGGSDFHKKLPELEAPDYSTSTAVIVENKLHLIAHKNADSMKAHATGQIG